ncbi:hypothetical protein UA08_03843 [Talaromyces atroroseus]|uniref:Short-chain dehydrogenase n=1 Tax=Talaromyces atroroseus TaxID=1441469 RepID=A0A225AIX2_TALAT|nr:hypothetical protein UA08_03843 [Talaromyces atroroseus]OKL61401.1 hypothetical protein UA08_03843 [Talaromyces atroroseus]
MPSFLITGASRGIGLGFAAELLKDTNNTVIATARNTANATGLQELKAQSKDDRLVLLDLDVSKLESIQAAAKKVEQLLPDGLDNLISNAGVSYSPAKTFEELNIEDYTAEVTFTVTTPLMLMREFLPLLRKGEAKKALFVTSILGSIATAAHLKNLMNAYSVARAGLNMLIRKWSPMLKDEGITAALIHPGWVNTDMGDQITEWVMQNNPTLENLSTEKSAAECLKVLQGMTTEDAGTYFSYDGTKLPF